MKKPATNDHPIVPFLRDRWSPVAFSSRQVERAKLMSLFEAARWSPSCFNAQPWSFVIAEKHHPKEHEQILACLMEGNRAWAECASVLVIAVATRDFDRGGDNFWASYDLGQAVAHMTVQATALGLSMHQMGGFDRAKATEVLAIPEGHFPVAAMAIGYYGEEVALPEALRGRETALRRRKPQWEFVHQAVWNRQWHSGD